METEHSVLIKKVKHNNLTDKQQPVKMEEAEENINNLVKWIINIIWHSKFKHPE